jgi:hypothetical protein
VRFFAVRVFARGGFASGAAGDFVCWVCLPLTVQMDFLCILCGWDQFRWCAAVGALNRPNRVFVHFIWCWRGASGFPYCCVTRVAER